LRTLSLGSSWSQSIVNVPSVFSVTEIVIFDIVEVVEHR
jgi:hypothetical protein